MCGVLWKAGGGILKKILKYLYVKCVLDIRENKFRNKEDIVEYDFVLKSKYKHRPGISAMLRIKNEEQTIVPAIKSIVRAFDEIVVVDNGSDDATIEKLTRLIEEEEYKNVFVYSYPHKISSLGQEHANTPEDSIHSFSYFSNWCLSKCTSTWVFKWDGDMVLPKSKEKDLIHQMKKVSSKSLALWVVEGKTVYIGVDKKVYGVLPEEVNGEDMFFPNIPWLYYRNHKNWEMLVGDVFIGSCRFKEWMFYEVKDVRKNEFSLWPDDIDFSEISVRKAREYKNYNLIKSNNFNHDAVEVIDDCIDL